MPSHQQDRYQKVFSQLQMQNRAGFCPFAVLGHPDEKESLERIKIYLKSNPDFLELGIPFSDPIADGPTIQTADLQALKSGTTPKIALQIIAKIRKIGATQASPASSIHAAEIPIGILTYSNIVIQYGIQKFYHDLKTAGADSILIADVPLEEIKPFALAARKNKLHQIFIISENTTPARLKQLQKFASGFFYVVSTLGVTGARTKLNNNIHKLIRGLKKQISANHFLNPRYKELPLMIGFGISNPEQIKDLKKSSPGGIIVGSALVKTPARQLLKFATDLSGACK